jgi:group I intron endonuclease
MYGIVYKAENPVNKKVYIGKTTKTLERRKNLHLAKSRVQTYHFSLAIRKYGIDYFIWSIIEECETKTDLNNREVYWINKYNSNNKDIGYNMTKGGDGGYTTLRSFYTPERS